MGQHSHGQGRIARAARYRYLGNAPTLELDLPTTVASRRDRFALLLSLLATEQFRGTAIFKRLREMHERLLSELPRDERGEYDKAAKRVRFLGPPVPEIDERIWNILIDSLIDPETLKLTYQTGHSGNLTTRHLDPYCLIARARDWMVVGHDHQHNEIRTFLLRRIKNLEGTGDLFDYPADFDVDKYFADAFDGDQSTGPTYHVKLRFAKENAQHGREFLSNSTQKITECKDGSVIVEFGTLALYRVVREVLAWGGKARVLGPPELIECTHSAVRNLKTCVTRRGICKSVA